MPLQRLRRVLQATYRVRIESSNDLVNRVAAEVEKRRETLRAKNTPVPDTKPVTIVPAFQPFQNWNIRAIDLLHKIGFLTTPSWANMARLSASWATRRYFWAIAEPDPASDKFKLSDDARKMDFHQKQLLSDEFGIGVAGLLMENFFGAASFVDISVALNDPAAYQYIEREGKVQPDYLIWGDDPNSPYYVVECKGTQTSRRESYYQLRRGLEQVPLVGLGPGPRQLVTMVVATCLLGGETEVFVVDPPADEHGGKGSDEKSADRVSERTGKRSWRISNPKGFHERTAIAEQSNLLKWAGQYSTASIRDRILERVQPELLEMPNSPLRRRETNVGVFRGIEQPLFPDLGANNLRLFTGVEEQLLDSVTHERPRVRGAGTEDLQQLPSHVSVSRAGTCMIIEGL